MEIEVLRSDTGFKLTPLKCGPNDDAFLGFLSFAFGESKGAKMITDQFVESGGTVGLHNAGDIAAVAGKFIDWLIVNHWGEAETEASN